MAEMFNGVGAVKVVFPLDVASGFSIVSVMSVPARTGTDVRVVVAFGSVAVCAPVPMDTKQSLGPSLISLIVFPTAGSAVEELAVDVTEIGSVNASHGNGRNIIFSLNYHVVSQPSSARV